MDMYNRLFSCVPLRCFICNSFYMNPSQGYICCINICRFFRGDFSELRLERQLDPLNPCVCNYSPRKVFCLSYRSDNFRDDKLWVNRGVVLYSRRDIRISHFSVLTKRRPGFYDGFTNLAQYDSERYPLFVRVMRL